MQARVAGLVEKAKQQANDEKDKERIMIERQVRT